MMLLLPDPHPGETREHYVARAMITREAQVLDDLGERRATIELHYLRRRAAMRQQELADAAPGRHLIEAEGDSTPSEIRITAEGGPVEIAAAAQDDQGEAKTPTFSMTAYTGRSMHLPGFNQPVVVDLTGLQIPSQTRPIRYQHSAHQGVGHTTRIAIEDGKLVAEGQISRDTPAAREIVAAARRGFPWQASIGAQPLRMEFVRAGASVSVNGSTHQGPLHVARAARLGEISFVDLGADDQTTAAIAAQHGDGEMTFDAWLKANGFDPDQLSDAQKKPLKAQWEAETAEPARKASDGSGGGSGDRAGRSGDDSGSAGNLNAAGGASGSGQDGTDLDDILAQGQREAGRQRKINAAVADLIAERPQLTDQVGKLARNAIEAGTSAQEFELQLLRFTRNAPHINAGRGDSRRDGKTIEAALCLSGGLDAPEKHFDAQTLEAADREFGRGLGLIETMLMFAHQNGYRGHGASNLRGLLQCAFSGAGIEAAGFSNLSLPGILSNTANKFLRQGFDAVESAWRQIAATRSVRDFKEVTSYSLTGDFEYQQVAPSGELKHASPGETKYTNRVDTYGRMFSITRTDLVNDDLGALTQVPTRIGRGGALKLNKVFWTEFMDNASFFAAGNKNFSSGASTALGIDSLTEAEALFLNQVDPDGNPVAITPRVLLTPPALKALARQLMNSTEIRPGSSGKTPVANPHAGNYEPVVSSYLQNSEISGNSAKKWYLLASPMDVPVIEVAFLNGRQVPVVESADADFNVLGVQMRGYHDFGVKKQEFRGGVAMKGEA